MKRSTSGSVLLITPDLEGLRRFVEPLNTEFFRFPVPTASGWQGVLKDYRPTQRELRRLVEAWRSSGPNVEKLLQSDSVLAKAAQKFSAGLIPTKGPTARLFYLPVSESLDPADPTTTALGLFLDFLLNPFNTQLGGPCLKCGKYFVKENRRHRVYCSKRCGLRHTALEVNRKRRADDHAAKLRIVRDSILRWTRSRTQMDWKDWVLLETRISKNWLTRRLKSGELSEPVKEVSARSRSSSRPTP